MITMTPDDLKPTEREKIVNFLSKHPVGVLATVDSSGNPNASTIYFSVNEDMHITFTTKENTSKYENITKHNSVMLVVFEAETQTAVQVSGKAKEVTDPEEQQAIYHGTLDAAKKTGKDVVPPIAKIAAGRYVGFAIDIENMWLSEFGWGDTFAHAKEHANDPATTGDPS